MNIVVTGSLGNISRPLAALLISKGHTVTVISSKEERRGEIEALGARAAIGRMQDADFLAAAFKGADIAYLMEAVGYQTFFDHTIDVQDAIREIVNSYRLAIERSGVNKVVHLSSIGAHKETGSGMLAFHYHAEQILNQLPEAVSVKFMRPVGFYYNMFAFIKTIREQDAIIANYGGSEQEPWVSPLDIAAVIAEEMEQPFEGRTVRYIASDEISPDDLAQVLGAAVGKPGVQWKVIPDGQLLEDLLQAGMSPKVAAGYVAMNAARRNGVLYEDYYRNRPVLGAVKVTDFARDFAAAYHQPQKP